MRTTYFTKTSIDCRPKNKGLSIEETVRRAIATNSPLEGNAAPIFTAAEDGVRPEYDIRTDKQDIALQAMDKYQASDAMKGFINRIECDENGEDGKGNKVTFITDDNNNTE